MRITNDPGNPDETLDLAPSSETSVVWSLNSSVGGTIDETILVGFNDYSGAGGAGWAWTEDSEAPAGEREWHYCNMNASCGPGDGPVPLGTTRLTSWDGDPHLAAANDGSGVVVYTNMADRKGYPSANLIAAAISTDGGRTFRNTVAVNEHDCAGGVQDQQAITFDTTTSPSHIWITWRHRGVLDPPGKYGICIRGGVVDPATATIVWDGPDVAVPNLATDTTFHDVGGILVEAHEGVATIAYLQNFDFCANTTDLGGLASFWSVSYDSRSLAWTGSSPIALGELAPCLAFSGGLESTGRTFGFTHTSTGEQFAVVPVLYNALRVYSRPDAFAAWAPVTTLRLRSTDYGIPPSVLYPTIDADADDNLAIGYIASDPTDVSPGYFVTTSLAGIPDYWSSPLLVSEAFVPMHLPSGGNLRWLGDYNGIAGSPLPFVGGLIQPRFFAAWADEGEVPYTAPPPGMPDLGGIVTVSGAFVDLLEGAP